MTYRGDASAPDLYRATDVAGLRRASRFTACVKGRVKAARQEGASPDKRDN